jgi:hypothetical protein
MIASATPHVETMSFVPCSSVSQGNSAAGELEPAMAALWRVPNVKEAATTPARNDERSSLEKSSPFMFVLLFSEKGEHALK